MKKSMPRAIWGVLSLVVALVLPMRALQAQPLPAAASPQLSVITFGRGDQVHQYFAHDALLIESPDLPEPDIVNYGMFSFGRGMIPKFLKGRLEFWVGETDYAETVEHYRRENRDVRVSELNLSDAQRRMILHQVAYDLQPEHRVYLYDHYFDNCSTRLRDLIDLALHGQLRRAWARRARFDLREQTRRYTRQDPVIEWLMMFGLNDRVDRPLDVWGQAFLPEELELLLDGVTYRDEQGARVPLVRSKRSLFHAERAALAVEPARRWPFCLAIGVSIASVALLLAERVRGSHRRLERALFAGWVGTVGIVIGLLGVLLSCLWAFTDHLVAHHNENLFLANPVSLVAGITGLGLFARSARSERWLARLWGALAASSVLLLLLKLLLPALDQDLTLTAATLIPINLGFAWASRRVWTRSSASH